MKIKTSALKLGITLGLAVRVGIGSKQVNKRPARMTANHM